MSAKKSSARIKAKPSHATDDAPAKRKSPVRSAQPASKEAVKETTQVMDARSNKDRRQVERREASAPVEVERRAGQRRAKVSRRRQIDPTTCERDYSVEEVEFMSALDDYKRRSGRMFPTCSEILEVIRELGYEKRADVTTAALPAEPLTVNVTATEQAV